MIARESWFAISLICFISIFTVTSPSSTLYIVFEIRLGNALRACSKAKKLFLFDMDGTIYLGDDLFEGVSELLQKIENKGGRYVFITNNASKSVSDYVAKLHRLGLTNVTEEHFFTSAQAMLMLLKEKHADDLIYLQGTKSLVEEYKAGGLHITTEYTDKAGAIVVAFDPEFTGEKVYYLYIK